MNPDFLDAHSRHWEDAEMLFNDSRLPNADHLYGMAAECGLKRLMMVFGMQVDSTTGNPSDRQDWKHIDQIWCRFESYRSGHTLGVNYVLPANAPFSDWKAEQRYANRSNFDNARVQPHRDGAQEVRKLIKKAQIAGLL